MLKQIYVFDTTIKLLNDLRTHHFEFGVRSKVQKGSTFYFQIPKK